MTRDEKPDPFAPYCVRCHQSEGLHHTPNIYTGRVDARGHPYPPACDQFTPPESSEEAASE